MTSEQKKEYTLRITQANKTELIVILYEMFLTYLNDAEASYENQKEFKENIIRARGCINELMNSLDMQYEISKMLFQLYVYISKTMTSAMVYHKREPLKGCRSIIEKLHGAYEEISKQDDSEPVMENSQILFAGLTYGRNFLNENMYGALNRGYFA